MASLPIEGEGRGEGPEVVSGLIHKKKPPAFLLEASLKRRRPTLPHCGAVPSARSGLTSLFGMGRGGTPRLKPPKYFFFSIDFGIEENFRNHLCSNVYACIMQAAKLTGY